MNPSNYTSQVLATIAVLGLVFIASPPCFGQDQQEPEPPPFMPIGVWFEGLPKWLGVSEDASAYRAYLDRCFADLAKNGLNCVTVPNVLPKHESLLLEAAAAHGLKVVMEVDAAKQLISASLAAPEIYAKTAAEIASRHQASPALLRYQIRDEPPPDWMPAWLAMQRALARADPLHPSFSCFNSATSLRKAREASALSEAVFDIYPLRTGSPHDQF
ncbi:MAG: hypothetical protein ABIH23_19490, partial [bacterium]